MIHHPRRPVGNWRLDRQRLAVLPAAHMKATRFLLLLPILIKFPLPSLLLLTAASSAAIADINLLPRIADISLVPCSLGDVFIRHPVDRFSVIADAGDMSDDRCRPT